MDGLESVVVFLLGGVGFVALCSLFYRAAGLEDDLWVEVVIITLAILFIYLVVK